MKKSLLALAVLGAYAGGAAAQSSVTLYGTLDLNGRYVKADGQNEASTAMSQRRHQQQPVGHSAASKTSAAVCAPVSRCCPGSMRMSGTRKREVLESTFDRQPVRRLG